MEKALHTDSLYVPAPQEIVETDLLPLIPKEMRDEFGAGECRLVAADVIAVLILCSVMNWQLYLVVRSVAQGNPWAVGRGVAGLELTLTPGLGLAIGGFSGGYALVQALLARRRAS